MTLLNVIISALAGLLGVVLGSTKQLIDWQIEKRKLRREERKQLLERFRALLLTPNLTQSDIVTSIPYSQLRPYLSYEVVRQMETRNITMPAHLRDWKTVRLLDDLHRIEKEWGFL